EAAPAWQEYIDYINEMILNGIKATTLISLKNMLITMTDEQKKIPPICILVELIDDQLTYDPPLVEETSQLSLQENLNLWMNDFIQRGLSIEILGNNKMTYSNSISQDSLVIDLIDKIRSYIDGACLECQKLFTFFDEYSFLYRLPVNQSFEHFLHGEKRIASKEPTNKRNFINEHDAGRR
ncbi:unnamed protein product, partial [Didymodactylos carnosus]